MRCFVPCSPIRSYLLFSLSLDWSCGFGGGGSGKGSNVLIASNQRYGLLTWYHCWRWPWSPEEGVCQVLYAKFLFGMLSVLPFAGGQHYTAHTEGEGGYVQPPWGQSGYIHYGGFIHQGRLVSSPQLIYQLFAFPMRRFFSKRRWAPWSRDCFVCSSSSPMTDPKLGVQNGSSGTTTKDVHAVSPGSVLLMAYLSPGRLWARTLPLWLLAKV